MAVLSPKNPNRTFPSRIMFLLIMVFLTVEPLMVTAASAKTIGEDQLPSLYAALVLKIVIFVDWPEDAPDFRDGKVPIGVKGDEQLFETFQELSLKTIHDRGIVLERCKDVGAGDSVRVLYIAADDSVDWPLNELPPGVLTIGDAPDFNAQGGMIQLGVKNGRPGFTVNLEAASQSGIVLSSQLLKVASIYEEVIP